jgi:hypothetical protein
MRTRRPAARRNVAGGPPTVSAGRPRDPALDKAIFEAADGQLRGLGYAGMSIEGTTVPSLRRRVYLLNT